MRKTTPPSALISFFFIWILGLSALAAGPCALLETPLPELPGLTRPARDAYLGKLRTECDLSTAYKNLRQTLLSRYDVSLERLTEYQAMRFVRREDFDKSKAAEIPVQLTYQIHNADYELPNAQKSSVIWDNWAIGIRQLDGAHRRLLQGRPFGFNELKTVHVGFFTLSDEAGDAAWIPNQGEIKPPSDRDNYWWAFNTPAEAAQARAVVQNVNARYAALGLLPALGNEQLNSVLTVRRAPKRGAESTLVDAIYSTDSRAVLPHVEKILEFVNRVAGQSRTGRHLVINGQLLTPGESAYLAQKYYVGVHPFSEGNGRTSRFLQELLLTLFELPHGSSGDLMDIDVLSTFDSYYQTAIAANRRLIAAATACFQSYDDLNLGKQTALTDQMRLPYGCRILRSH